MKRNYLKLILLAVIVVAAGTMFSHANKKLAMSDMTLANVEALATCEKVAGTCWMNTYTWECCDAGHVGCAPCD
ncbi:MAG: NVEALA domain-containing protein [Tannerellaceae bacterium]|jgi:hypothetical protein|nr:NVEALA domain-containing protein [Tannerellaceae bacterium]